LGFHATSATLVLSPALRPPLTKALLKATEAASKKNSSSPRDLLIVTDI
jgi:hypothetical protein